MKISISPRIPEPILTAFTKELGPAADSRQGVRAGLENYLNRCLRRDFGSDDDSPPDVEPNFGSGNRGDQARNIKKLLESRGPLRRPDALKALVPSDDKKKIKAYDATAAWLRAKKPPVLDPDAPIGIWRLWRKP